MSAFRVASMDFTDSLLTVVAWENDENPIDSGDADNYHNVHVLIEAFQKMGKESVKSIEATRKALIEATEEIVLQLTEHGMRDRVPRRVESWIFPGDFQLALEVLQEEAGRQTKNASSVASRVVNRYQA